MIRKFLHDNGVLLLATGVVTPLSLLFSIVTARVLGPEQYGVLAVMIALQQVLAQTVGSFSLVTAKYVAEYRATGDYPAAAAFLRRMVVFVVQVGAVSVLAFSVMSPFIRSFLRLPSTTTVILIGMLFVGTLGVEVVRGLLQGLQAFGRLALNQIVEAASRLALGIGILAAGFAINGVLAAYIVGVLAAILIVIPLFRTMTRDPGPRMALAPILLFTRTVILVGICNVVLINADLILVKHYFPPFDAGIYAAVATFGRVIYIGAIVLWTTMFPTVAAIGAVKGESARLLLANIGVIVGLAAVAVLVLAIFGQLLLRNLYGDAYTAGAGLLALYGISILIALPVNAVNFYSMARSRLSFVPVYMAGACLQIGLIVAFHASLRQVVLMVCASNSILLVGYALLLRSIPLRGHLRLPRHSPEVLTAGKISRNGEGHHP